MAIKLRQGEEIQNEAQFHKSIFYIPAAWAALLTLSAIGQLFIPRSEGQSLLLTLLIGLAPITYVWLKSKNKSYVITNQRLYVEDGILAKTKIDIPFQKINDISLSQSLTQRMLGSGNVMVMTGNNKPTTLRDLENSDNFREVLSRVCQHKSA